MPVRAPDFVRLFAPGTSHASGDGHTFVVKLLPVAPLSLPSGRVIAIEPFKCGGDPDELVFTQHVPPGTYPVTLVAVDMINPDGKYLDTGVTAARLEIRDEPVVRWELALPPGEDIADLDDDELYGYSVDGGLGCFIDAENFRAVAEEERFSDRVLTSVWKRDPQALSGPLPQRVDDPVTMSVGDDRHALVVFGTGWGDGVYATWIGRTAGGDVACFLTDFQVLPPEDTASE